MTAGPALLDKSSTESRLRWLDFVLIAIVTFAVFTPVLHSAFSPIDDQTMLLNNPQMKDPSWGHFVEFWSQTKFRIYMPLPLTIWQMIGALTNGPDGTLRTLAFKIVSIGCHCAAAMAAAWTLSVLTRSRWPAIIGALVFALHPFQVESVAWTTGLKDVLCGLFAILAVGSYARFAQRDRKSHWNEPWWWVSVAWSVLAMCSKPTAMTIPALLIGVDLFSRRSSPGRRAASLFPMLVPAGICGFVIATAQAHSSSPQAPDLWRPLVVADTYAFYLRTLAWPWHMCVDYGRSPPRVLAGGALAWTWIIPLIALAGVAIVRSGTVWLAALLFVIPVVPTSGIVPFDMQQYSTVADHYMYQPMLGAALFVAWAVQRWRCWGTGVAIAVVCVCASISWNYAQRWRSPRSLFEYIHALNPQSWMAESVRANLAIADGNYPKAERLIASTLKIFPHAGPAWDSRSYIALQRGRYRESAEDALIGAKFEVYPTPLIKRAVTLGAALKDRDLAKRAVQLWIKAEPQNPVPRGMIRSIMASEAQDAATRPATTGPAPAP